MEDIRIRALVHGRVQGVCFRAYTEKEAASLNITGTVRNLSDGSVEVIAEGERGSVESFIAWLRKGPTYADVKDVEVKFESPDGKFQCFSVVY